MITLVNAGEREKTRPNGFIRQIAFHDIENDTTSGGIMLQNGDIICGCCGGILEASDEGITWNVVKFYDNWVNISDEIMGDDIL